MIRNNFIFRYRPVNQYTLAELKEGKHYLASPIDFNDPFESNNIQDFAKLPLYKLRRFLKHCFDTILPYWTNKERADYISYLTHHSEYARLVNRLHDIREYLQNSINDYGMICFSKVNNDILMWSHYADSHRGICIIYDRDVLNKQFNLIAVKYTTKYPDLINCINDKNINLTSIITNKSKHWAYEKEVRLIVKPELCSSRHISLPHESIVGVIHGSRIGSTDESIVQDTLSSVNSNALFYKARKSEREYKIHIDHVSGISTWIQKPMTFVGIALSNDFSSLDDKRTPAEVKLRYDAMASLDDLVIWANGFFCGIKAGKYERAWLPEEMAKATLILDTSKQFNNVVELAIKCNGKFQILFSSYIHNNYLDDFDNKWYLSVAESMKAAFNIKFIDNYKYTGSCYIIST